MLIFHLCAKTFLRNFIDSLGSLNSMRIHAIFKRKSLKQKKKYKKLSHSHVSFLIIFTHDHVKASNFKFK